jgi:hypothetical protein
MSPFFALKENTNYLYRAYRYPYEWIPQLDRPREIPLQKTDCAVFRVPGAVENEPQNVSVFEPGDDFEESSQICILAPDKDKNKTGK